MTALPEPDNIGQFIRETETDKRHIRNYYIKMKLNITVRKCVVYHKNQHEKVLKVIIGIKEYYLLHIAFCFYDFLWG